MIMYETETKLQNSPIYNISMCSLENFHTCFLKWLGQNYPRFILNTTGKIEPMRNKYVTIK